jgi:hypothetical protein
VGPRTGDDDVGGLAEHFLAALVAREVRTTEALLSTLEELTSPDVRVALERDLRR